MLSLLLFIGIIINSSPSWWALQVELAAVSPEASFRGTWWDPARCHNKGGTGISGGGISDPHGSTTEQMSATLGLTRPMLLLGLLIIALAAAFSVLYLT
jgi:hypothetical protein